MVPDPLTKNFSPIKIISLKAHPEISETWVQQVLFDNPFLFGLGSSVKSRDQESRQTAGGRLESVCQSRNWKFRDSDPDVFSEQEQYST